MKSILNSKAILYQAQLARCGVGNNIHDYSVHKSTNSLELSALIADRLACGLIAPEHKRRFLCDLGYYLVRTNSDFDADFKYFKKLADTVMLVLPVWDSRYNISKNAKIRRERDDIIKRQADKGRTEKKGKRVAGKHRR